MAGMPENEKDLRTEPKEETYAIFPEAEPIVTDHTMTVGGKELRYKATVGMLPLRSDIGEIEAGIFHTTYTVESDEPRPLMFSFNGGPGSASVWLHLGAVGPKRVKLLEDGGMPAPPYELIDNPETWLEHADLVFIDPVGTGFSHSVKRKDEPKYWGLEGDINSISDFIRLYLTRHNRWLSPLYIVGESYGTTRAAGLSESLGSRGISLNGIILVSSILNFQTARFTKGNDLPYYLFFPTYVATAWYHKKLATDLQELPLRDVLAKAEQFAKDKYWPALAAGANFSPEIREAVVNDLSRFTGLSKRYIDLADCRIGIHRFCKELLRDERRTVGRLDSRYKGIDGDAVSELPEFDPSSASTLPAYTSTVNDYLRRVLKYETDLPYHVFNPGELWKKWKWGPAEQGFPDTSEQLRSAMSKNPYMKIFIASGYYDLATPYFATEYTVNHMGLDQTLIGNVIEGRYEAGHMMYVHETYLKDLKRDVAKFFETSTKTSHQS